MKSSRRRSDRVTLNMASMIDATFLLLAYFLVTAAVTKPEDKLSPTLQTESREAGEASDFQPQKVVVELIDGKPGYRLAARVIYERDELRAALDPLPRAAGVFIHVHDEVPVEFAVAAIQIARDVGFDQVTYVPAKD